MKNIRVYFQENNHKLSIFSVMIAILSLVFTFCFLFLFVSPWASTFDQVDFALALNRFDLLAMQPHFPGYPYFVLGGTIIHQFIANEAKALAIFNGFLLLTAIFPLYSLFRTYLTKTTSLIGVAVIMSSVYPLVISAQPMSEGSAIAILWWYLWSIQLAKKSNTFISHLLPLFLFSIMLGVRLSYIPFGVGLILLWWKDIRKRHYFKVLFLFGITMPFQLIWIYALIYSEGGVGSFLKLAFSFTNGHFEDWGGTVASTNDSLAGRLLHLVIYNYVWTGICFESYFLLIMWGMLVIFLFYKGKKGYTLDYTILIQGVLYFLWAFFAQNVEKPRHILPLIGIGLFYLLVLLLQKRSALVVSILFITLFCQQMIGFHALKQQAENLPATYQLAHYYQSLNENSVLYTWEESRVLEYLNVSSIHKPVFTYDYFLQDKMNYKDATIYLTNHVVKGFQMQGINSQEHLEEVTEFRSSSLFDPVYNKIIIYKWKE